MIWVAIGVIIIAAILEGVHVVREFLEAGEQKNV